LYKGNVVVHTACLKSQSIPSHFFATSATWSMMTSLLLNNLLLLTFQMLHIPAAQITLSLLRKTLPLPIKPSNWSKCARPAFWKTEVIPNHLLIVYQVPANTGHSKKRCETVSSAPHSPTHWMDLWSIAPLLYRLSFVATLFCRIWNYQHPKLHNEIDDKQ
jgi:hypothetical protein